MHVCREEPVNAQNAINKSLGDFVDQKGQQGNLHC